MYFYAFSCSKENMKKARRYAIFAIMAGFLFWQGYTDNGAIMRFLNRFVSYVLEIGENQAILAVLFNNSLTVSKAAPGAEVIQVNRQDHLL